MALLLLMCICKIAKDQEKALKIYFKLPSISFKNESPVSYEVVHPVLIHELLALQLIELLRRQLLWFLCFGALYKLPLLCAGDCCGG